MNELELLPDFSQSERTKIRALRSQKNLISRSIRSGDLRLIAKTCNHSIYMDDADDGCTVNARFYAIDDLADLAVLMVDGDLSRSGDHQVFTINVLQGRNGSRLKAHRFYGTILLNMPIIFVAEQQSYGGMRTWQELSKHRHIEMFGWLNGRAINVDPTDQDETHASEDDVYRSPHGYDKHADRVMRMKLVAHRKITKHGR